MKRVLLLMAPCIKDVQVLTKTNHLFTLSIYLLLMVSCQENSRAKNNIITTEKLFTQTNKDTLETIRTTYKTKTSDTNDHIDLNNLQGIYSLTTLENCNLEIIITEKEDAYYYVIQTDKQQQKGQLEVKQEEKGIFFVFKGFLWKDDYELTGTYDGIQLTIQNYGNAMNPYHKLKECGNKYLELHKENFTNIASCDLKQNKLEFLLSSTPVYEREGLFYFSIRDSMTRKMLTRQFIPSSSFPNEKLPEINIRCINNTSFAINYSTKMLYSYITDTHHFNYNKETNTWIVSKVYHTLSDRQSTSISAVNFNPIPIENYNVFNLLEKKQKEIYNFRGFQEEKIPQIDSYYTLVKSNYETSKKDENILIGSIIVVQYILDTIEIHKENLEQFNDTAFYLQQSGALDGALLLLKKIIKEFPNRTVAYINLGDTYWGLGEVEKAKEAYKTYAKQMKANGKEAKIPKIVLERLKN